MYFQYVYLKPLFKEFDNNKDSFKTVHLWVKLNRLSTNCWNWKAISQIAYEVGVPLRVDKVTKCSIYANSANVLIEKQIGSDYPLSIEMFDENDILFTVNAEYIWRPTPYSICKVVGHDLRRFPSNKGKKKASVPNPVHNGYQKQNRGPNFRSGQKSNVKRIPRVVSMRKVKRGDNKV